MFHKALWLRNYKQGRVALWLSWAVSLFALPIEYLNSANSIVQQMEWWGTEIGYSYIFRYSPLLLLGGLSILLACILIGGERTNQGMDTIFAMPFERRDIFLSKWFLGVANIAAITLVNMILMYVIQNTTIHGEYQTFAPFLDFFLLMFIALLAVYSLALFIGTITGAMVSQALLTVIVCFLPDGVFSLISEAIHWHTGKNLFDYEWYWKVTDFFRDISLYTAEGHSFEYNQWGDFGNIIDGVNFIQNAPSLTMYIATLIYLILSFLLGLYLFKRTPSENNGKIILYKKLEPIFLWSAVICFALLGGGLGGSLLWNAPLIGYYIGLLVSGFICYKILTILMKKPLKFGKA